MDSEPKKEEQDFREAAEVTISSANYHEGDVCMALWYLYKGNAGRTIDGEKALRIIIECYP